MKLGICEGLGAGFCAGKLGKRAKIYIPGNINTQMILMPFSVLGRLGRQGSIERMLSFFMMDIGEYHADIQRNCKESRREIMPVNSDE